MPLPLPSATWKDERCASMRFIARCYKKMNRYEESQMWLNKAIEEAPYLRDPYIEMALLQYNLSNWKKTIYYCKEALKIKTHTKTYINEPFSWDETPYDLLAISYFYLKDKNQAISNIDKAIKINPNNERLINNKKIIESNL